MLLPSSSSKPPTADVRLGAIEAVLVHILLIARDSKHEHVRSAEALSHLDCMTLRDADAARAAATAPPLGARHHMTYASPPVPRLLLTV
eukprot:scaffold23127_cov112-Isochrysis_galbana.AAC.2